MNCFNNHVARYLMSVSTLSVPHCLGKIKINPVENDYAYVCFSLLAARTKKSLTYNDKMLKKNSKGLNWKWCIPYYKIECTCCFRSLNITDKSLLLKQDLIYQTFSMCFFISMATPCKKKERAATLFRDKGEMGTWSPSLTWLLLMASWAQTVRGLGCLILRRTFFWISFQPNTSQPHQTLGCIKLYSME